MGMGKARLMNFEDILATWLVKQRWFAGKGRTVHDLAIYRHQEWFPGRQPLSTRLVVPRSIKRADSIIAVSHSTARDLEELFSAEPARVHVIPEACGQEILRFIAKPDERLIRLLPRENSLGDVR